MAHSLSDFKSNLIGGGARPNLFEVTIDTTPEGVDLTSKFPILCKAAALPASTVGSINVPFRGRIFKVAGDRTFEPWTITIINDEDFVIRTAMETWVQRIAQYSDGSGDSNPADYMRNATVKQLKRSASKLNSVAGDGLVTAKEYRFFDIFPTNISAIDLSYDTSDTIEEFTVEFQVQYWAPSTSTTNNPAAT